MSDQLRETILEIYNATGNVALWPAVLDKFSDLSEARGCLIYGLEAAGNERRVEVPFMCERYDRRKLEKFLELQGPGVFQDQDVFTDVALAHDDIDLIDDQMLADARSDVHGRAGTQYIRTIGIAHWATGLLDKDNSQRARISIHFTEEQGPLLAEQRDRMSTYLPHIAKALDLSRPAMELAAANQTLLQAIDHLRIGVCVLDDQGRVAVSNTEFMRQAEVYGAFKVERSSHLKLANGVNHGQLARLASDAMHHGQYGARPRKEAIMIGSDNAASALCIDVVPLDRSDDFGSKTLGGSMLFSLDTSLPFHCDPDLIGDVFGLSQAETALIGAISDGLTNGEIAERRDRSPETIKAQVSSILSKTRCSNRTQLVRLLNRFSLDVVHAADDP